MTRTPAVLLLLGVLIGCGGGSDTTDPGGNPGGITNFTAKIDGVAWAPTTAVTAINPSPGLYSLSALRVGGANAYTMVFQLYNIRGPGTYQLGAITSVFGGSANLSLPPSGGWSTPLNGTAGELVITTLTPTRMVGTFRFDAEPQAGSTGTRNVTEGVMDIPISGTGGVAAANQGSKLTGNIGGTFAAAGVNHILGTGSNPTLTITATNGTRNLTISLANMTGVGTYALSAATPVRSVQVSGQPGNLTATWGSQVAGGSGSVEITSVTATRIIGSFNATLAALAGGASGTLTASGSFELGRP
jgi:hypothetical protein